MLGNWPFLCTNFAVVLYVIPRPISVAVLAVLPAVFLHSRTFEIDWRDGFVKR